MKEDHFLKEGTPMNAAGAISSALGTGDRGHVGFDLGGWIEWYFGVERLS